MLGVAIAKIVSRGHLSNEQSGAPLGSWKEVKKEGRVFTGPRPEDPGRADEGAAGSGGEGGEGYCSDGEGRKRSP